MDRRDFGLRRESKAVVLTISTTNSDLLQRFRPGSWFAADSVWCKLLLLTLRFCSFALLQFCCVCVCHSEHQVLLFSQQLCRVYRHKDLRTESPPLLHSLGSRVCLPNINHHNGSCVSDCVCVWRCVSPECAVIRGIHSLQQSVTVYLFVSLFTSSFTPPTFLSPSLTTVVPAQ